MFFSLFDNCVNVILVVNRQDAAKSIGAEMLDERRGELVPIITQQLFELIGVCKLSAVGQTPRGIDSRIWTNPCKDSFVSTPLPDGVILIERKA